MNIDERLAALAETVELLAAFHRDNEKRAAENEKRLEKMMQGIKILSGRNTRLEELVTEIAEGTARILHVVEVHEQRINRLEAEHPSV